MRKPIPIGFFTPSASYPSALSNRHFWYDPSDLTTITKDGGNIISRFNDKLGNGNDLVTGAALWTANTVLFDGISQYLRTGAIPAMQQPTMIYMSLKQVTWTSGERFFDGAAGNRSFIEQRSASPGLCAWGGSSRSTVSNDLAENTWGIIRVFFDGASSKFIINNETPITGDWGTSDMEAFTLGAYGLGTAFWSNIQVKDIIAMPSTESEADIYAWLVTRL